MGFYAGDSYNFILNIPAGISGVTTVTSAPIITILNILNPGSPIISGAAMTLITGTSFLYFYSFAIPDVSPADYVAIYSYATSNAQSLGTATAATWSGGIATYTFPLPLPVNVRPGALLTTVGFTSAGGGSFNATDAIIKAVDPVTGHVTAANTPDPGAESVLGTGNVRIPVTVSNQSISTGDRLHVGDSNITGQVALNATVAQNATVAKDATVMKSSQYVAPGSDPTVQDIDAFVTAISSQTTALTTLLGTLSTGTMAGLLQDVYDNLFGSWSIDQTVNPPVLHVFRINGSQIATFELVNNNTVTQRTMLTHPAESNV